MLQRFRQWLSRQGNRHTPQHPAGANQGLAEQTDPSLEQERSLRLAAESEVQRLRLDLDAANQRLLQLQGELLRQGRGQAAALDERLEAQLEAVLTPLATPLAQLLTQQHLIEQQGKELSAKDLLATSRRLWQGLSPAGVAALESIGALVPFDPDRHQPLSQASVLANGDTVLVKIPGITLKGRVIKAAAVEPILHDASCGDAGIGS